MKKLVWLLIIFLTVVTAVRLTWVTKGHFYWNDELRYLNALKTVELWHEGYFQEGIRALFHAHARPGYILLCLVPAAIQWSMIRSGALSLDSPDFFARLFDGRVPLYFNPHAFDIVSIFNVLMLFLCALVFFKVAERLLFDRGAAFYATVIYSFLVNTNLYIRHFFPFDAALLFYLLGFLFSLRAADPKSYRFSALLSGIFSGFAFCVYPSYYFFVLINGAVLFVAKTDKIKKVFLYAAGSGGMLLGFEALSRWAGTSFFEHARALSGTAIQGSLEEGLMFPLRYLIDVEGIIGGILLFFVALFTIVQWKNESRLMQGIYLLFWAGLGFHAVLGVIFHKAVFYGRILHMYFPFFVIFAVRGMQALPVSRVRKSAAALTLMFAIALFIRFSIEYGALEYPFDLMNKYAAKYQKLGVLHTHEHQPLDEHNLQRAVMVTVNAIHLHPIRETVYRFEPPEGFVNIYDAPHTLSYSPYRFEGHSVEDRQRLKTRSYKMGFYVREIALQKGFLSSFPPK